MNAHRGMRGVRRAGRVRTGAAAVMVLTSVCANGSLLADIRTSPSLIEAENALWKDANGDHDEHENEQLPNHAVEDEGQNGLRFPNDAGTDDDAEEIADAAKYQDH